MTQPMCSVPWCVAFAAPESDKCPVHRQAPNFVPVFWDEWEPVEEGEECECCGGSGTCECDDCGAEHECGKCAGEGRIGGFSGWRNKTTGERVEYQAFRAELAERTGMAQRWLAEPLRAFADAHAPNGKRWG
jgi:hypothetical protein